MNLKIDENEDDFDNSPLILTTEVCNPGKCKAGKMEGVCISGESCFKHGGQAGSPCNGSSDLICCTCQYLHKYNKILRIYYKYFMFYLIKCFNSFFRSVGYAVLLTCGDVSNQKVTYLQSPDNAKIDTGSMACDYDVVVQKSTCAVR